MDPSTGDGRTGEPAPAHEPGEAIGPGQDWALERLMGRDESAELWLARHRRGSHGPRALQIFTSPAAADWLGRRQNVLWTVMHKLWGHPHVVKLLDIGLAARAEQGHPFVAMEYVPGGSLEHWIGADPGRRPPLRKQEVMRGVVSAVAEAHRQGIHHGGLTPACVLLTRPPDVRAKVAGFGLTGPGPGGTGAAALYETPEAVGAAGAAGERAGYDSLPDPARADVFALGVTWYQLLVERLERPPYDFADALAAAGQDAHTIRLLSRCLASPGRRFADAVELDRGFGAVGLPQWPPVPVACFDVSGIVREYVRTQGAGSDVSPGASLGGP